MPVRTVSQLSLQVESISNGNFFFGSYSVEVLALYERALYVGLLGTNLLLFHNTV
jgi:hypothetical protein